MSRRQAVRRVAARGYWRETEARAVVEAWRQSGERLAAFAGRHGIARRRLERWVRRLGACQERVRFHRVQLVGRGATDAAPHGGAPIEIEWAPGRRVRVMPGFAAEDLSRVIETLEAGERC